MHRRLPSPGLACLLPACLLLAAHALPAQGPGRGRGPGGGGGGGLPPDFHEAIHQLFAHPEKIRRRIDLTDEGYLAETTSPGDADLAATLRRHVRQMSGRLEGGRPVRRWDPAFEEFFRHYDAMEHTFTDLEDGIRVEVRATTPEAVRAAHNHARIILDFSSQGDPQMHTPHRTALDEDGGASSRFRGGPPEARRADLAPTFGSRAEEAADALVQTLGGQLKAALQAGGPAAALPVCHTAAIPLTAGVAERFEGLEIRRVSERLRNPANAPDDLDREALARFRGARPDGGLRAHLATAADGRTVRYYRPLFIAEACLQCHGPRESMAGETRELLATHYPEDAAHGYALGDLRGLIRVQRAAPGPKADGAEEAGGTD